MAQRQRHEENPPTQVQSTASLRSSSAPRAEVLPCENTHAWQITDKGKIRISKRHLAQIPRKCTNCEKMVCKKCSQKCRCGTMICTGCAIKCPNVECIAYVCARDTCQATSCKAEDCNERVCEACRESCDRCGLESITCGDCLTSCRICCEYLLCYKCVKVQDTCPECTVSS